MNDNFDDILNEQYNNFNKGKQQGLKQAQTYTMQDIQKEGRIFGQQLGEQFAKYEQFIIVLQSIDNEKLSNKIFNMSQQIKQMMNSLKFQDINQIKHKKTQLAKKYNVLLAMLGIKSKQKQNYIKEERYDF